MGQGTGGSVVRSRKDGICIPVNYSKRTDIPDNYSKCTDIPDNYSKLYRHTR